MKELRLGALGFLILLSVFHLDLVTDVNGFQVLHHPNIIQYYENFFSGSKLVIAMEYAPGVFAYTKFEFTLCFVCTIISV